MAVVGRMAAASATRAGLALPASRASAPTSAMATATVWQLAYARAFLDSAASTARGADVLTTVARPVGTASARREAVGAPTAGLATTVHAQLAWAAALRAVSVCMGRTVRGVCAGRDFRASAASEAACWARRLGVWPECESAECCLSHGAPAVHVSVRDLRPCVARTAGLLAVLLPMGRHHHQGS